MKVLYNLNLINYRLFIKILCILVVLFFFYQSSHHLIDVRIVYPSLFLPAALISVLLFLIHGLQSKLIFTIIECRISFINALRGALINSLGNSLLPFMAGIVSSVIYFKKVVLVEYNKALIAHGLGFSLTVWVMFIALVTMHITKNSNYSFAILATANIIIIAFPLSISIFLDFLKQHLPQSKILNKTPTFHLNIKPYLMVIMTIYLSILSFIIIYWCYLNSLGHTISIENIFYLSVVGFFTSIFSILPFSFGLREICFAAFASQIDSSIGPFIAASLLDRVVSIMLNLLLSTFIFTKLTHNNK